MGMSWGYGPTDDEESLATIAEAIDRGVTFFDTAEVYGPHVNERLVGQGLKKRRDSVVIATKFGFDIKDGKHRILETIPKEKTIFPPACKFASS